MPQMNISQISKDKRFAIMSVLCSVLLIFGFCALLAHLEYEVTVIRTNIITETLKDSRQHYDHISPGANNNGDRPR